MRRNRKREPLRVGTIGRSFLACVCVAAVGIGYVWQKNQIYRLGDEIKKRETTLQAAQKRNTMLAGQLAHLKSPAELEARCQQYNLGLVSPHENQVVRVYEPGVEWDVQFASASQPRLQRSGSRTKVVAQR
jgi:cell division protein FtsB